MALLVVGVPLLLGEPNFQDAAKEGYGSPARYLALYVCFGFLPEAVSAVALYKRLLS